MKNFNLNLFNYIKGYYLLIFLRYIYFTFRIFSSKSLINHSASSAFYFLLSVVPLGLFFVYVLDSWLMEYGRVSDYFFNLLSQINPEINRDFFINMGLLSGGSYIYGIVGVIALLWSSRHIFKGMKSAFNIIFNNNKNTGVIKNSIVSFIFLPAVIIVVLVFLFGSIMINQLKHIIIYFDIQSMVNFDLIKNISSIYTIFFSILVVFLIYKFLPGRKVKAVYALTGAVLFVISLIIVQKVLGSFIYAGKYYSLYKVISVIIIALIWAYVVFSLLYFYAVFIYVLNNYLELELTVWYSAHNKKLFSVDRFMFNKPLMALKKYGIIFKRDNYIYKCGENGGFIYILLSGNISLYRDSKFLADIGINSFFGVSGVMDKKIYDTDALCLVDGTGLKLPSDVFYKIINFSPEISTSILNSVIKYSS